MAAALTQAERDAWADKIQARFEEKGGIADQWIIPSGTSTTLSRTPTGLLSPPPSKDLVSQPHPWEGTTSGCPPATELIARLKRVEKEQRRAGTQFRLQFDFGRGWRAFPDDGDPDPNPNESPCVEEDYTWPLTLPATTKRQREEEPASPRKKRKVSVDDATHDTAHPGRLARDIGHAVRKSKPPGRPPKKRTTRQPHPETDQLSPPSTGKPKAKESNNEDGPASSHQAKQAPPATDQNSSHKQRVESVQSLRTKGSLGR
ncbi:MAG: hypothetical protein Q9195_005687 [Heterodermia aff. obscurata]